MVPTAVCEKGNFANFVLALPPIARLRGCSRITAADSAVWFRAAYLS
jgi:hypothetical protein